VEPPEPVLVAPVPEHTIRVEPPPAEPAWATKLGRRVKTCQKCGEKINESMVKHMETCTGVPQ